MVYDRIICFQNNRLGLYLSLNYNIFEQYHLEDSIYSKNNKAVGSLVYLKKHSNLEIQMIDSNLYFGNKDNDYFTLQTFFIRKILIVSIYKSNLTSIEPVIKK